MKKKFILLAMMLLTLIGGVNLNVLNAQTQYRVKFPTLGDYYLTIFNNISHPDGAVGGVGVDVYQESNAQKFTIETGANGGVYLKSADGYYIYCNGGSTGWNVDAINGSDKSELYGFDMNGGSFKIYDDNGYIKVQEVNSVYYIFHDASSYLAASWQLVEVATSGGDSGDGGDIEVPENLLTVEVGEGSTGAVGNSYYDTQPFSTYYNYTISQQIYTAEELGNIGTASLYSVAFKFQTNNNNGLTRNLEVYLKNVSKETFTSTSDWVSLTSDDMVYNGTIEIGAQNSWLIMNFSKPFDYEGGNVLVCVYDKTGSYANANSRFYGYSTNADRCLNLPRDSNPFDVSNVGVAGHSWQKNNQIRFTYEASTDPIVKVNIEELDFGTVRAGGDFWTEKEIPSFNVEVTAKNTTIKSVSIDDDFFTSDKDLDTAAGQAEFNFTVSYNKAAEAGYKSGNIVVTYMNGEEEATVEIPMSATAYVPAQGDVVEDPKAITFTEGAYTDNVTGVYDDYILPNEENDGNNGDAVYTFTLTEESLISANVEGTNGLVAIYRAADLEGNGPSSENSFAGNENNVPEVSMAPTTFFNGFETGDFTGWQNIDGDGDGNVWEIATGGYASSAYKAVSHSYTSTNLYPENYLITDQKYLITENSKLIVCATSHNISYLDGYKVMVSETGEMSTFVEVEAITAGTVNDLVPYETDLSAYAGKEVYIAINHYTNAMWALYIDNVELTDGSAKTRSLAQTRSTSPQIENVYPAGEYVLVAAAEGDFTLNITTGDIPAPEATTYVSPENNATEVTDATLVFQLGKYTDEYQVLVGTSADALKTVVDWTSELATTYTLADAADNTKYYWQVNTRNAKDVETTGVVWSFVTPLDVPQNVTATATELYQDNNTTTISWTEIEGLTYNVYVDGEKQNEEAVAATEYVLSDLAWSPEGHSVTVTANHGELGESPMSEAVVVKVAGTFTFTVNVKDAEDNAIKGATVELTYLEGAIDEFGNQLTDVYETVMTNESGMVEFKNVKLLGDWATYYYEIKVTKDLYQENIIVINNDAFSHGHNEEVDVDMSLMTIYFEPSAYNIYFGESVTLTWEPIGAENVTYNVYVNGEKHNTEAIAGTTYVISDLPYNINGGNEVAVTAVHSLGETPQDPVYIRVAGTFTLDLTVTDGTNPIKGATVNIDMAYAYDEFKNQISPVTVEPTDADGKTTVELPILCQETYFYNNNGTYVSTSYYTVEVSKSPYQDNNWNYINYYEDVTSGYTMDVVLLLPMVDYIQVQDPAGNYLDGDVMEGTDLILSWDAVEGADSYKVYTFVNGEVKEKTTIDPKCYIENVVKGYEYAVSALFGDLESEKYYANLTVKGNGYFKGYVTDGTKALEGIQVKVSSEYGDASAVVTTDEEGYFYGGIMEGENYILTISHSDYDEFISTPFPIGYQTEYDFETIALNAKPSSDVTSVTATVNGDNVDVEWTVEEATKYNVYRRLASAQDCGEMIAEEIEGTTYTDTQWTTVVPGTYQYGVAALVEPQAQTRGTEVIYIEDFEHNGDFPEGWDNPNPTAGTRWKMNTEQKVSGSYSLQMYSTSNYEYERYLTSAEIDINVPSPKLKFQYMFKAFYNGLLHDLTISVKGNNDSGWTNVYTVPKEQVDAFKEVIIPLEGKYNGDKLQIQFYASTAYYSAFWLDDLSIVAESPAVETQIVWSNEVVKQGPNTFEGTVSTDWNVAENWSNGVVPAEGDNVTIEANAVITSGNVNVKDLAIYPNVSLTVGEGTSLTVTGLITQKSNYSIVLEEGGQIFQNNNNVTARFKMSIDNPSDWSDEANKDGWQFISMPLENVPHTDFTSYGEYDLYKYDGSQELEWLNHKAGSFAETEFISGVGYLASLKDAETATVFGTLNTATSKVWGQYYINNDKVLANFKLLGNPFTFDMDMAKLNSSGTMVTGYAVVNANGEYEYKTDGTVKVGNGFFVKLATDYAQLNYDHNAKSTRSASNNSLNITATGNAGEDNVIINLAGKSEGFDKLQNFNDAIATVYVAEGGKNYGIYNCDADVQEVELSFNANQMGNYTISIEPNGKFQTVTLVDRFTGIETNMLVEDYHFTAMSNVNTNRFIVRMVNGQESTDNSHFVYQSGEDLIIDAEGTVQIIDVMGRVLVSDEVESTNNRINVSGFQNGTYMVRVINGSEVKVEKVVIY